MQAHPDMSNIRILVPNRLNGHHIKDIRILPERDSSCFKIQYAFETWQQPLDLDVDRVAGVDLEVDNLAACATPDSSQSTSTTTSGWHT